MFSKSHIEQHKASLIIVIEVCFVIGALRIYFLPLMLK